jgi:hypothetical protein
VKGDPNPNLCAERDASLVLSGTAFSVFRPSLPVGTNRRVCVGAFRRERGTSIPPLPDGRGSVSKS